jgi:hypothetical protein
VISRDRASIGSSGGRDTTRPSLRTPPPFLSTVPLDNPRPGQLRCRGPRTPAVNGEWVWMTNTSRRSTDVDGYLDSSDGACDASESREREGGFVMTGQGQDEHAGACHHDPHCQARDTLLRPTPTGGRLSVTCTGTCRRPVGSGDSRPVRLLFPLGLHRHDSKAR